MAMSVGARRTGAIAEINVTPMADVMIVLLIIFMIMTPIVVNAPVRLPEAAQATEHEGEGLEVTLGTNGLIQAGKETFATTEAFSDYLAMRSASGTVPSVLIQADRSVSYTEVARLLAACRRAGTVEVALAARRQVGS